MCLTIVFFFLPFLTIASRAERKIVRIASNSTITTSIYYSADYIRELES